MKQTQQPDERSTKPQSAAAEIGPRPQRFRYRNGADTGWRFGVCVAIMDSADTPNVVEWLAFFGPDCLARARFAADPWEIFGLCFDGCQYLQLEWIDNDFGWLSHVEADNVRVSSAEQQPDDEHDAFTHFCDKCGEPCPDDWSFAWCEPCGRNARCRHGELCHECNECAVENERCFEELNACPISTNTN